MNSLTLPRHGERRNPGFFQPCPIRARRPSSRYMDEVLRLTNLHGVEEAPLEMQGEARVAITAGHTYH
jgi:hypothetical protein